MGSLTKLRQKRSELAAKAAKAHEASLSDERTETEVSDLVAVFDESMASIAQVDADIARAESVEAILNDGKKPAGTNELQLDEEKPKEKLITIPAASARHNVVNFIDRKLHDMDAQERGFAFGRYLFANAALTLPGKYSHHYNQIQKHEDAFGPLNAATSGGNAGVFVPDEFGTDLVSNMLRYGLARQVAKVVSMSSGERSDPKEGSDPTPSFSGEGVEATDVTPTDDSSIKLVAKKLTAILINSSELNEDAISEFGDSMMRRLANGFAAKEDSCFLIGDGSSTYGGMVGINTALLAADPAGATGGGLAVGTTSTDTSYSNFVLTDFEDVVSRLPDFAEDAEMPASWIVNRSFYYNVMVRLELAAGGVTALEIANGRRTPIFLGYPVRFSNTMPKTPAATQVVALFGDYRRAATFGDRRSFSLSFSDQATVGAVNLWSSDQVGTKATERFDIAVHSVGSATAAGPVVGLRTIT